MSQEEEFLKLVDKYLEGRANAEELVLLDRYYALFGDEPEMTGQLSEQQRRVLAGRMEERLFRRIRPARRLWPWVAAASVLLVVSGYLMVDRSKPVELAVHDVAPFSRQAVLKTGGRHFVLDSNARGVIAKNIRKTAANQIAYSANEQTVYDTLEVPAGAKPYHLTLSDGSLVVVNVASSLRFPENMSKAREAELISGEADFKITHNADAPFSLKAKNQEIEDIGTEFDVNTYADEPDSRTTLIEGKVKVNHQDLKPGEQAIVTANNLTIEKADIDEVTSWKNGYFRFNGEDIQTIMRQLERWYNIQVTYEGPISKEGYYVKISRSRNISDVLHVLERTNSVHFKIEGRRVTVSSKT